MGFPRPFFETSRQIEGMKPFFKLLNFARDELNKEKKNALKVVVCREFAAPPSLW